VSKTQIYIAHIVLKTSNVPMAMLHNALKFSEQ